MASVVEPADRIRVSVEAASTFSMLFDKRLAKGVPKWDSFKESMRELGFRMTREETPRWRFDAPVSLESRSMMVEEPETGRWKAKEAVRLGRKLTGTFGWSRSTFFNELDHTSAMIAQREP